MSCLELMARLLVDMALQRISLSPGWIPLLLAAGQEAVQWSEVGDPRAPDTALMQWAMANGFPVLRSSRSRQVCMTCHFFRHHPGPNGIPLLICHLHQGLIAHGEHLTHR
jgi:hypothetical protein